MPQIALTQDEARMLDEVVRIYLSDLRMEIVDTEEMELREKLKREEAFLKDLVRRLGSPGDTGRK